MIFVSEVYCLRIALRLVYLLAAWRLTWSSMGVGYSFVYVSAQFQQVMRGLRSALYTHFIKVDV